MLEKENIINPKKSKTVKEILKQEPHPAPTPVVFKQEIQTVNELLIARQLQAQTKSERTPPQGKKAIWLTSKIINLKLEAKKALNSIGISDEEYPIKSLVDVGFCFFLLIFYLNNL